MWSMGPKRTKEDLRRYKKDLEERPNHFVPHMDMAMTLADLGRHKKALDHYAAAIRLNPNVHLIYECMGHSLHALKRNGEAVKAFEEASRVSPNKPGPYYEKGVVLHEMKRYKEALAAYKKTVELDPDTPQSYFGIGNVLSEAGRDKKAIKWYNKAIRLSPDDPQCYFYKAWSLAKQGLVIEAAECCLKVMKLEWIDDEPEDDAPDDISPKARLKKIKKIKEAVRADPDNEAKLEKLCRLYDGGGMNAKALESSLKLLRINPDSAYAFRTMLKAIKDEDMGEIAKFMRDSAKASGGAGKR